MINKVYIYLITESGTVLIKLLRGIQKTLLLHMIQQLPRGSRKQRPNKHSVLFTVQQHRVHEVDKFLWLYVDSDANMFCMSVKLKLVNNGTTWLYQVILLLL